jgi:hypothetical protein
MQARLIDALARLAKALPEGMVKAPGNVLRGFAEMVYWGSRALGPSFQTRCC